MSRMNLFPVMQSVDTYAPAPQRPTYYLYGYATHVGARYDAQMSEYRELREILSYIKEYPDLFRRLFNFPDRPIGLIYMRGEHPNPGDNGAPQVQWITTWSGDARTYRGSSKGWSGIEYASPNESYTVKAPSSTRPESLLERGLNYRSHSGLSAGTHGHWMMVIGGWPVLALDLHPSSHGATIYMICQENGSPVVRRTTYKEMWGTCNEIKTFSPLLPASVQYQQCPACVLRGLTCRTSLWQATTYADHVRSGLPVPAQPTLEEVEELWDIGETPPDDLFGAAIRWAVTHTREGFAAVLQESGISLDDPESPFGTRSPGVQALAYGHFPPRDKTKSWTDETAHILWDIDDYANFPDYVADARRRLREHLKRSTEDQDLIAKFLGPNHLASWLDSTVVESPYDARAMRKLIPRTIPVHFTFLVEDDLTEERAAERSDNAKKSAQSLRNKKAWCKVGVSGDPCFLHQQDMCDAWRVQNRKLRFNDCVGHLPDERSAVDALLAGATPSDELRLAIEISAYLPHVICVPRYRRDLPGAPGQEVDLFYEGVELTGPRANRRVQHVWRPRVRNCADEYTAELTEDFDTWRPLLRMLRMHDEAAWTTARGAFSLIGTPASDEDEATLDTVAKLADILLSSTTVSQHSAAYGNSRDRYVSPKSVKWTYPGAAKLLAFAPRYRTDRYALAFHVHLYRERYPGHANMRGIYGTPKHDYHTWRSMGLATALHEDDYKRLLHRASLATARSSDTTP